MSELVEEKQEKAVPFDRQVSDFKKNDSENADRLAALCAGKFLYCTDLKTWLKYDGRKWDRVESVELQEPARLAILKELSDMAAAYAAYTKECAQNAQEGGKIPEVIQKAYNSILKYLNGAAQNNMAIQNSIKLAAGKPSIKCKSVDFDNDPYLLNCANGVLNLKTFELMPHSPKQRFMKCTRAAYSPEEHSSLWRDTVRQIVPDNDTYDYLQRMAGYCLTGSVQEQKIFFLFGPGGTGKSTFVGTLDYALGDYSSPVPIELLLESKAQKDGNGPTQGLAELKGLRLAVSSESGIGKYFDAATIKYLTGEKEIKARPIYTKGIKFPQSHKFVISSNYAPFIRDITDDGFKRRLVIIPMKVKALKPDTTLGIKLEKPENLSDCLLWAVEGCRKWQALVEKYTYGLAEDTYSQEIKEAIGGYYYDNDTLGEFVNTYCTLGPNKDVDGAGLYSMYLNFSGETEYTLSRKMFTSMLMKRYPNEVRRGKVCGGKVRGYKGIGLKNSFDS